jgi:transposase
MGELERAWRQPHDERSRRRLQVLRLVAQHQLNAVQIAGAVGCGRRSVFRYIGRFMAGGVDALLERHYEKNGRPARLDAAGAEQLRGKLEKGGFKWAKEAQGWLAGRGVKLALPTVCYWLKKAGGVLKVPRKTHAKKDAAKAAVFRENLAGELARLAGGHDGPVRLWVADEHRHGLLPVNPPLPGSERRAGARAVGHAPPVGLPLRGAGGGRAKPQ